MNLSIRHLLTAAAALCALPTASHAADLASAATPSPASAQLGSRLSDTPEWETTGSGVGVWHGREIVGLGDIDGNGYPDMAVFTALVRDPQFSVFGMVEIHRGTIDGFEKAVSWTLRPNQGSASDIRRVAAAGDVNGDGYADMAVAVGGREIAVFYGSSSGFHNGVDARCADADWFMEGDSIYWGIGDDEGVNGVGDVNGDGFDDLMIRAKHYTTPNSGRTYEGAVLLYYGSAAGLPTPAPGAPARPAESGWEAIGNVHHAYLGDRIDPLGDINGDGYADFALYAANEPSQPTSLGVYYFVIGGANGPDANLANSYGMILGTTALNRPDDLAAADFDRDGYDDVVYSYTNTWMGGNKEPILMLKGGPNGMEPSNWGLSNHDSNFYRFGSCLQTGDFDGDGAVDLAVMSDSYSITNGAPLVGKVEVYFGNWETAAPIDVTPDWTWVNDQTSGMSSGVVRAVGDPQGDQTAALAIGMSLYDVGGLHDVGRVLLFDTPGPPCSSSPNTLPDWSLEGQLNESLGRAQAAGDFNGDGFEDLAISDGSFMPNRSVSIYRGSANGLPATPNTVFPLTHAQSLYPIGLSTGDVNGDGYEELLVNYHGHRRNGHVWPMEIFPGGAQLFNGSSNGIIPVAAWEANQTLTGPTHFGKTGLILPDINGDGYDDIAIGAWGYAYTDILPNAPYDIPGAVYLWMGGPLGPLGGASGTETNADWQVHESALNTYGNFGRKIGSAGDLNGDGCNEILIGAPLKRVNGIFTAGSLKMWMGATSGYNNGVSTTSDTSDWEITGTARGASIGRSFAGGKDLSLPQDGIPDLVYFDETSYGRKTITVMRGLTNGFDPAAIELLTIPDSKYIGADMKVIEDFDGDLIADVAVGAGSCRDLPNQQESVIFSGGFAFEGDELARPVFRSFGDRQNIHMPRPSAGDFNGDGLSDLLSGWDNWFVSGWEEFRGKITVVNGRISHSLWASLNSVARGDSLRFTFQSNSTRSYGYLGVVSINGNPLGGGPVYFGPLLGADENGVLGTTFTVPANVQPGVYEVAMFWRDWHLVDRQSESTFVTITP